MIEGPYAAPWIFIIDTNSYAGNFERQMCAYATGRVGECNVGEVEAKLFQEEEGFTENPFEDFMLHVADKHGCRRPCAIWVTPGRVNDGHGHHYDEAISMINPNITRYPAYESVACFFHVRPSVEQIVIMKRRCKAFSRLIGEYSKERHCVITGFRLIEQFVREVEHISERSSGE